MNDNNTEKKSVFRGACTALITPFRQGSVDYSALGRLIDHQIDSGISALLFAGTTGESPALTYEEHTELTRFAVRKVGGRVPVIIGTGSNDTEKAKRLTRSACSLGADAVLTVTPYYNKANKEGLIRHFESIADVSEKPVILYNVPSRTCVDMTPEIYRRLYENKNIYAVKEASQNIVNAAMTRAVCPGIDIYCGSDDMLLPHLSLGACGIISVMSNIFPEVVSKLLRFWENGDHAAAGKLYFEYLPFCRLLFSEVNPVPVKYIMEHAGMICGDMRLPLYRMEDSAAKELVAEYEKLI